MRTTLLILMFALATASCGGSQAANCSEYAAEVRHEMENADSAEDLMRWLEDTSEHAARLIQSDPDDAEPCAEAMLEAMLTAGVREFEQMLDSAFTE